MEHLLGRIEPGYAADLTLVRPDILTNLSALVSSDAVKCVFIGGKLSYKSAEDPNTWAGADPKAEGLGGPYFPGKNGKRKSSKNPWGGKCLCCRVR